MSREVNIKNTEHSSTFRPIHYLGSKLRIIDFIEKNVDRIDPTGGRICDLFSGSGSVSAHFSGKRQVTSIDIQEYSRLICSALLLPSSFSEREIEQIITECSNASYTKILTEVSTELISYEEVCLRKALSKEDVESLCDLLENGSIISYELGEIKNENSPIHPLIKRYLSELRSRGISRKQSMVFRHFGGIYFSFKQAVAIDCLLEYIDTNEFDGKDSLMASLMSTVSDCVNTVGKQFAQPIRPRTSSGKIKPSLGKMTHKDREQDVFKLFAKWVRKYSNVEPSLYSNQVLRMDFLEALEHLETNPSVIYADPPYTRDHYSRFYHVLETIALRDDPEISTMKLNGRELISRGLYRENRHQSPFCIRSQAPSAFESIFSKAVELGSKLILSYSPYDESKGSHPRVVTMSFLTEMANRYYDNVEVVSSGNFVHSKLNSSDKHLEASEEAEVLIICY